MAIAAIINTPALCEPSDVKTLSQEQAEEKLDLEQMKEELEDIKGITNSATQQLNQLNGQSDVQNKRETKEFHLYAKEMSVSPINDVVVNCLGYNGKTPGPIIRVKEGDIVKVVLHNQLKEPTSLHFHGMTLPHSTDGLPRKGAGLLKPGEIYTYQFIAKEPGTFWYHPQIIHAEQQSRGLCGAIVVEPVNIPPSYEKDYVLLLGQLSIPLMDAIADRPTENLKGKAKRPESKSGSKSSTKSTLTQIPTKNSKRYATAIASLRDTNWPLQNFFMVNGRSAPLIPPLNVKSGERIRFRVINASQDRIPLHLTGHRFEICATNGSEGMEAHVMRDTVCLEPSDRYDLEITTDNPGVWSFGSENLEQCTSNGKFPGGIAIILRYDELMHPKSAK